MKIDDSRDKNEESILAYSGSSLADVTTNRYPQLPLIRSAK